MFSNLQWAIAADNPVATLAMFTVVDTAVGVMPVPSRIVDDVGPKPLPSAPSTSEATKPAKATSRYSDIGARRYQPTPRLGRTICRGFQPPDAGGVLRARDSDERARRQPVHAGLASVRCRSPATTGAARDLRPR